MSEPVVSVRMGQNCPYNRSQDQRWELVEKAITEAFTRALEEGLTVQRMRLEPSYHSSGLEPQCSYAEVEVFDRFEQDAQPVDYPITYEREDADE